MSRSASRLDSLAKSARRRRRRPRQTPSLDHLPIEKAACENLGTMPPSIARVLGPYKNGDKWRLVLLDGEDRKSLVLDSYDRAIVTRDNVLAALKTHEFRTFGEALEEYQISLKNRGVQTAEANVNMLHWFFPLDEPLTMVSAERASEMYEAQTKRPKANGAPIATDTHHLLLRRAKYFFKWALSKAYVQQNPFAGVRALGRPKRGKPQLRIDEARKLVELAMEQAQAFDVGATAALMQVFLGLRPTEAVIRVVRDLDDDGRVLWIPFGKTSNSRRRLKVPEALRQVLLRHAHNKPADAPLLGPPGEKMHKRFILRHRLRQLCAEAGVPRVCPHSLRGLNATLAIEAGATAHHVAAALGHASFATTARHYADASAVTNASLRKVADVLTASKGEPAAVRQLATLIREHLSADQIQLLREQLAA